MKKKILVIIVVIAILVCAGLIVIGNINKKTSNSNNATAKMNDTKNEVITNSNSTDNKTESSIDNNNSNTNNDNKTIEITNGQEKNAYELIEIEKNNFERDYTIINQREIYNKILNIEKQNKNLSITILEQDLMKIDENDKVKYNTKYVVENIKASDVKDVFMGEEGHEGIYPLVYILQNDGTVKGINIEDGCKTGKFIAKNISNLKDVKKIEQADVHPKDDSGYMAVLVTTNDGKVYELRVNG